MIARCQLGFEDNGRCGAIMTYPIKGYPWRRNPVRFYEFQIDAERLDLIFREVVDLPRKQPKHCLDDSVLWVDATEKANGITRDDDTDTLCHTISMCREGELTSHFSMREDSDALRGSELYRVVMDLIKPYETLEHNQGDN